MQTYLTLLVWILAIALFGFLGLVRWMEFNEGNKRKPLDGTGHLLDGLHRDPTRYRPGEVRKIK